MEFGGIARIPDAHLVKVTSCQVGTRGKVSGQSHHFIIQ